MLERKLNQEGNDIKSISLIIQQIIRGVKKEQSAMIVNEVGCAGEVVPLGIIIRLSQMFAPNSTTQRLSRTSV